VMGRGAIRSACVAAVALGFVQCARPRAPAAREGSWQYVVTVPPPGSWTLAVEATIEGAPVDRLVADGEDSAFGGVSVLGETGAPAGGSPAPYQAGAWLAPSCHTRCRLRYVVDLDALAEGCRRIDCGRRIGDAVVSQASAWLLRPETPGDATVHVRFSAAGASAGRFVTGLRRDAAGGYVFRSEDLSEASYTAFGTLRHTPIEVGGATLDVIPLGDAIAMGDAGVVEWVRGAARCVASLNGRFPVDATVFVVPAAGADEVVFGRVMSLAGASVVLLFGAEARPEGAHSDWVVVHELFHLSTPSFVGEGHWLEEGLATYYEPILRERAGWIPEAALWGEFVREMPRALRKPGEPASLEERDSIDATYWGGALFALLADVRIRTATRGSAHPRSLDDVLHAVLGERGDATHRARVADFLQTGDAATGTQAPSQVYAEWAVGGANVDLDALWRSLGIEKVEGADGSAGIKLNDGAPLADVRRAIAGREH
jgi:hypothetical protein